MDAFETTIDKDMTGAEAAVREALGNEGFGVLTEIDVAATLKEKLGVLRAGLKILGACNPSLAHRAMQLDPSTALVLPCNVTLEDVGDGRTRVAIVDPRAILSGFSTTSREQLDDLGDEAAASLSKVVTVLGG